MPVPVHLAHPAGDRGVPDHGVAQRKATRAVGGRGRLGQAAGQQGERLEAVEVVGVGHPEGRAGSPRCPSAASTACTVPRGAVLEGEAHVDRRRASGARRGSGWPGRWTARRPGRSGENPAATASPARRSITASPAGPTGARGLQPP